ncbi:MAG: nitroreductase family deazaflavin-dependent oxidoreductase [Ktedonobacteraceae bacterium]|nr:nitroreductase family deazaflavin-dependent oxidoreductase [Ktedonobacteraceae bacterium]
MARTYRLTFVLRLVNIFAILLLRAGVKIGTTCLLMVRGRKTGQLHTIAVTLVEQEGRRWLVAPYGAVNWVHNARAAEHVMLSRGRHTETVELLELGAADAAPILQHYLKRIPVVRPFFDVTVRSSLEAFEREAPRHPVFLIVERNRK